MLDVAAPRILYFDKFSLDLARGSLRAGDQDIELRPKAFEVLKYLAINAGRLVTKQELYGPSGPMSLFLTIPLLSAFGSCAANLRTTITR